MAEHLMLKSALCSAPQRHRLISSPLRLTSKASPVVERAPDRPAAVRIGSARNVAP